MSLVFRAPGRVNLIGEHTDYNGGYVLPIAIDLECRVTATPSEKWSVTSKQFHQTLDLPLKKTGNWTDYIAGVVLEFGGAPRHLEIDSTVPHGSGLSSSAALEVSTALAVTEGNIELMDLVRRTNKVEREFVGMPCGIMDQYVSVFGKKDHAILIDCQSETHRTVPLPPASIVIVNSMVKHQLSGSAYRDRVRECAEDCKALGVPSLREVSPSKNLPPRARHVASENQRVLDFAAAQDVTTMGRLMIESHHSLRDDYEVSCEELDFLVEQSLHIPGVYGARMTGGGFGGCIVALVDPLQQSTYADSIHQTYHDRYHKSPEIYPVTAAEGAGII